MVHMVHLVLLPGMDGTGELFAEFVAALDSGIAPIVVRYPADQALDYRALERFARGFLPADAPFVLLGESFSGPVAIALAASRPPGLLGLVLSCTFAVNPHPWFKPFQSVLRFLPISVGLADFASPVLLGKASTPARRSALRKAMAGAATRVFQQRLHAVLNVDYAERLADIDVPILYLQASNDRIVPASATRRLMALAPPITVELIAGPHLLLQAMPCETAAIVSRFVRKMGATSPR
ncbi:MAG: alpha/beta fold hydrolase [Massilia sp.]